MVWFLAMVGIIWGLGHFRKWSHGKRLGIIAVLYTISLLMVTTLPADHPVVAVLGDSPSKWIMLGVFTALAIFYGVGLKWLKAKARPKRPDASPPVAPKDTDVARYARHIMLREIGGPGQKKLKEARVLVIGAGGLGSPALMYLAAAGVGTIGLIDDDAVEITNLQRQIAHTDQRIGMPKVFSAERAMMELNPAVEIRSYHRRLTDEIAAKLVSDYDIVLDGTDNFDTRYLTNRICVATGTPLVSGALTQWEGQISVFDPARNAPCYQCVFPERPAPELAPSCAEAGVLGPLPGVLGAMMAVEAVKLITQAGDPLLGRMMIYDALYGEIRTIRVTRRADCEICGVDRS